MQIKKDKFIKRAAETNKLQSLLKAKETIAEQILNGCYLPTRETIPKQLDTIYTLFSEMCSEDITSGHINASYILDTLYLLSENYISLSKTEKLTPQEKFTTIICGMFDNANNTDLMKSYFYLKRAADGIERLEQ